MGRIHASDKLHQLEYTSILHNKLNFALYCERNDLNTPMLISHNFGTGFFFRDGIRKISDLDRLITFYEEVFDFIDADAIFFRPLALNGGQGCFRIDRR
jgi:hypothetical protein